MSPWEKPNEMLVRLLDEMVGKLDFDHPVDYRPMFGCPAYFTGGNMFAGVWQDTMMLRLSEDDRAEITSAGGKPFEPMPGRAMKEYVALPPDMIADHGVAAAWVGRAAAYAASLPPKEKKPRKKKA